MKSKFSLESIFFCLLKVALHSHHSTTYFFSPNHPPSWGKLVFSTSEVLFLRKVSMEMLNVLCIVRVFPLKFLLHLVCIQGKQLYRFSPKMWEKLSKLHWNKMFDSLLLLNSYFSLEIDIVVSNLTFYTLLATRLELTSSHFVQNSFGASCNTANLIWETFWLNLETDIPPPSCYMLILFYFIYFLYICLLIGLIMVHYMPASVKPVCCNVPSPITHTQAIAIKKWGLKSQRLVASGKAKQGIEHSAWNLELC